jgi:hypothetical protein
MYWSNHHRTLMSLPTEILLMSCKSDSDRGEVVSGVLGAFAADTSGPSDYPKPTHTIVPGNTGTLVPIDCPSSILELASIMSLSSG